MRVRMEGAAAMKIVSAKNDLQKSINISLRSVPVHTTMPVLECVMINAGRGRIRFTTNDTELGIETIVKGEILEEGSVAVNAKMLSEIIRRLPDEDVTLSADENKQVTIVCGKSKFTLTGLGGEDFTYLPDIEKEEPVELSQFDLKELVRTTIFSIAPNENNRIMGGELFRVRGDVLTVVSLDGHRISIRSIRLRETYGSREVIIPGKSLIEISKILTDDKEDMVSMYFSPSHAVFEMPDTTVVTRLIDGEYFHVENMLSRDYETKIRVNRRDLLSSIDRSTLFVKENDKKPIIFDVKDGYINLFIESVLGSMNEDIDADKEGRDIMIGFNPRFLIDALRVIDDEEVTLYLVNPKAPCFIRNEEEDYIYIVLPVNFIR